MARRLVIGRSRDWMLDPRRLWLVVVVVAPPSSSVAGSCLPPRELRFVVSDRGARRPVTGGPVFRGRELSATS